MLGKIKTKFVALSLIKKVVVIVVATFFSLMVVGAMAGPPKVEVKKVKQTEEIVFETTYIKDDTMQKGDKKVKTAGKKGSKEVEYEITFTNDKETDKKQIAETILIKPENEVMLEGTREVSTEPKNEGIPFSKTTVNDPNMDKGKSEIRIAGANGEKEVTYEVTKIDGKEISRKAINEKVTKNPVTEVTAIGTKSQPKYICNCSKTCPYMSCDEAYFQLDNCGCSVRDGDDDGVPCENVCPGG
ncbi:hypothetical protein C4544_05735 [candidate division WS5 bacterium]|uniref:G5 domain-containing protein n=1 Tax=candidate division WS5 bacterium TaxID=2093353 RepID=A0A419DAY2_9BACT|nr:MAG: hypothetical protein C4544_05735 [candidate division WS5 bacterium]